MNKTAFSNILELANTLHSDNQKLVAMVDSSIYANLSDPYYKGGDARTLFIKSDMYKDKAYNGNLVSTKAGSQNSKVVFMDWFNDTCTDFLNIGLFNIYTQVEFDGVYL